MIGAGGTGGHVYPALAVAEAVIRQHPSRHEMSFVGAVGGMERRLVAEAALPFTAYDEILAGPLHGVNPLRMMVSIFKLIIGVLQSFGIVIRRRPQSILLTGGWANLPIAITAWVLSVPVVIFLPDIEPGLTIRALQRFARKVAMTMPESAQYFREGQSVVTGYPLREDRLNATREDALEHFQLDADRKSILVFGGSQGARSINMAIEAILPELLNEGLQVIHVVGTNDWERSQKSITITDNAEYYHAFPYLHSKMGLAFAAVDMVVCRSGASTLAELPHFGLASILVPYPYAWRYQKVNADYLADRGAAIRMNDEDMMETLLPTIREMLSDPERLSGMQVAARALAQHDGAGQVAQVLLEITERDK